MSDPTRILDEIESAHEDTLLNEILYGVAVGKRFKAAMAELGYEPSEDLELMVCLAALEVFRTIRRNPDDPLAALDALEEL